MGFKGFLDSRMGLMAWIESHTVLRRHRKLTSLAEDLRLKPEWVMGHLHALWHAALEQQEDGDLSTWSDTFITSQAGFTGDAKRFVRLLQRHKWLDGKVIHDWLEYAGRYLTSKYKTSNPAKLVEIWARHGKVYVTDKKIDGLKTDLRPPKVRPPDPPNLPDPDNPPNPPRANGAADSISSGVAGGSGYDAVLLAATESARKRQFLSEIEPMSDTMRDWIIENSLLDAGRVKRAWNETLAKPGVQSKPAYFGMKLGYKPNSQKGRR